MSSKKLKFALFGNEYQARKSSSIREVMSCLVSHDAEIHIDRPYYNFLSQSHCLDAVKARPFEGEEYDADFAISMGGDGTFLKAAARVGSKGIPIIGINMGRLGFLADIGPDDIEREVDALYSGEYEVEQHTRIIIDAEGETFPDYSCALNDISILKRDTASMISIRAEVDGEHLITYQSDGLIVCTPTGSTAYSLSNGGPIIAPRTGILCLTPVAPHSLNVRPIVIDDNSVVRLTVESRSHNFLVAIDGRAVKLPERTAVTIRKSKFSTRIVKRKNHKYFTTLRDKMMWGADGRD